MDKNDKNSQQASYPPVVAVLGHVDHGKTTLLDAIRKTSIADREHGGITQKIGASSVITDHEGRKRKLTFIDTPGHEAFAKMRGRGAQAADIGLLIVSSADGVMPQTQESIKLLLDANVPYIVVFTKADVENKITEKAKQQLLKEGVMLEGLGGDVPFIEVSARTNFHMKELLDLILLVFDLHQKGNDLHKQPIEAIVIESKLDQKAGPRATVVIKKGTLAVREEYSMNGESFKVRSLLSDTGAQLKEVTVGEAVEILGFTTVPPVGSIVQPKGTIVEKAATPQNQLTRDLVYQQAADEDHLAVVIAADTQGSLEAITYSLPEEVKIVAKKTGEITEADILLAKSTEAIVLGFNSKIRPEVQKLAMTEKVLTRNYTIIYEMLDEINDVLEGKRLAGLEQVYGIAQILASFPYEKTTAVGIKVIERRIAKGDKVRVERNGEAVGESTIASLRVGKNPVSKVEQGQEAGILLSPLPEFRVGDILVAHG
jgi:translation initiation factor IF-2